MVLETLTPANPARNQRSSATILIASSNAKEEPLPGWIFNIGTHDARSFPLPFRFENFNKNHNFSLLRCHCRSFVTIAYTNRHFGTLLTFVFMVPPSPLFIRCLNIYTIFLLWSWSLYCIVCTISFWHCISVKLLHIYYLLFIHIFRSFRAISIRVGVLFSPCLTSPSPSLCPCSCMLPPTISGALNRQFYKIFRSKMIVM